MYMPPNLNLSDTRDENQNLLEMFQSNHRPSESSDKKDFFSRMWKNYINLLMMNGKFLFDDPTCQSKNFFCELLHNQIDVSNKLFMLVSQSDDDTFSSFKELIGDTPSIKDQFNKSFFNGENDFDRRISLSDMRQSPTRQFTINSLGPLNYSTNIIPNFLEYPKSNTNSKENHYADIRRLITDGKEYVGQDSCFGNSLNLPELSIHNANTNFNFFDQNLMKRTDTVESPFMNLNSYSRSNSDKRGFFNLSEKQNGESFRMAQNGAGNQLDDKFPKIG